MVILKKCLSIQVTIRWETIGMTKIKLSRHLAVVGQSQLEAPDDCIHYTLCTLVKRWPTLDPEAKQHSTMIQDLTRHMAALLLESSGIGVDTEAEILIVVGDIPERIKSESVLAKLAVNSHILEGSGMTSGKQGINNGEHGRLMAVIYRTEIVRKCFHEP